MHIADNAFYNSLRNVYWISGTAYGGKTTMSRYLAEEKGFILYDSDSMCARHRSLCSKAEQPSMLRSFKDWDSYFNRPVDEYADWLLTSEEEEMDFILLDLVRLSGDRPVVADVHCFPEILKRVADPGKVVFLLAEPDFVREGYFQREDKRDMYECIMTSVKDPERSIDNVLNAVEEVTRIEILRALESGMECIVRDRHSTVEGTYDQIAAHFKL